MMPSRLIGLVLAVLFLAGWTALRAQEPAAKVEEGLAAKLPGDTAIERAPAVIFASGFENGFAGWSNFDPRVSVIVNDAALAHSGRSCAQTTATRGRDTGGDVVYNFPKGVDRLYLRFYCRFHPDTVMPHHFVKIRAIHGNYWPNAGTRPPGDKAFWTGIEPTRERTWHFYTYWYKMRGWRATPAGTRDDYYGNAFNPDGQKPFDLDTWICVEAMMKANTAGKSDGELAFWIDGRKIGHWSSGSPVGTWSRDTFVTSGRWNTDPKPFEGFDFRSDSAVTINAVALQWYVSDRVNRSAKTDRNIIYFDDVVLATEYVGPMKKK